MSMNINGINVPTTYYTTAGATGSTNTPTAGTADTKDAGDVLDLSIKTTADAEVQKTRKKDGSKKKKDNGDAGKGFGEWLGNAAGTVWDWLKNVWEGIKDGFNKHK